SGCVGSNGTPSQTPTVPQIQKITVTGSTTVLPIAEKAKEAFEGKYAYADIQVSGGGSSVGVTAAGAGTADIGMSSRDLTPEERSAYPNLVKHTIAWDALVVIVYPNNPVSHMTLAQIRGIYNGTITNWKDVSGLDQAIVVVGRDSASGTRTYLSESVMNKENFTKKQEEFNSNGGVQQKVTQTPGAIGYVGLGYLSGVKGVNLDINGTPIQPTIENIGNGTYPLARPLYLLTKGQPAGLSKQFIDYILSPDGQQIVESVDYIPLSKIHITG
ncbi:MAG: phosphate ABC transporter substrate-binding protein, partial [Methanomicrobiales archaeon]|nr:phosphate ABC transporter substrate-binding protein [Methanomicrobiales archaeon]